MLLRRSILYCSTRNKMTTRIPTGYGPRVAKLFLMVMNPSMSCEKWSSLDILEFNIYIKLYCHCYIAGFRSLPIYNFLQKTYTWLEKGSIWLEVSLTAAAKTMNKKYLCTRGSVKSFRARMQEIHIIKIPLFSQS